MKPSGIGERILLTLWVGGLWTVGYLVVPTLFHMLDDRAQAGQIAGRLFSVMNLLGLACGSLLLLSVIVQAGRNWSRTWQFWALLAMLVMVGSAQFMVQPMMAGLKNAAPGGFLEGSAAATRFGVLHGISSLMFLVTSLIGLILVVFGLHMSRTGQD